ncbi:unnamed protein product, partial [Mesorhabditis belari]|uniref:Uncharacterized protein n=1 Tax=Mesorhabditis belari TaxID=2138241 RepID=A0AAF3F7C1_9BILA
MGWGPPHLVSIFLVLLKVDEITSVLCSQCPFTPEPPHVNECPETCEGDVCYIVVNKFFNGTISAGCLNLRSGDHFGGENVCHREETRTICGCEGAARCNDPQTPLAAYKFVDEPVFSRDQPIPPLQSDEATVKPMLVTGTSEEQLIEVKSSMFVKSTDGVTGTPTFKPHSSTTNDITQLADLGKHLPSTAPSDILPALLLDNSTNAPETSDIVEIEENTTNPSNFAVVLSTVATAPTTVIEQEAENVPHLKPFPEANFSTLPHEAEMDNGKTMETKQTKQTSISIASNQLIDLKPPPPNTTLPPMEQSSPVIISKSTWNSIEIDRERKPSTSPGLDKETAPENGSSQGWGSVEEIESEHTRAPKANEPQRAGLNSAESGDEQAKGVASPQEGTTGGSPQTTVVFSILTIFLTTYLKL